MTRTKRTPRTARAPRKPVTVAAKLNGIKAAAISRVSALLEQGAALQQQGRSLVISKAKAARKALNVRAGEAQARTADAVSRFEKAFEGRVTKAISKLGVPTSRDLRALSRQVSQLQVSLDKLQRSRARA